MVDLVVKTLVNAVGVWAAIQIVPHIEFDWGDDWTKLVGVALILALVNSYLKPIAKVLSFPVNLVSLGLFTFVINAMLLLLVALISDQFSLGFTIGGFPPEFGPDAFIGALLGSVVISIVSTVLGLLNTGRKVVV